MSKKETESINIDQGIEYLIPTTPNFILPKKKDVHSKVHIREFSDDQLRVLGNSFTENLITKATNSREAEARS